MNSTRVRLRNVKQKQNLLIWSKLRSCLKHNRMPICDVCVGVIVKVLTSAVVKKSEASSPRMSGRPRRTAVRFAVMSVLWKTKKIQLHFTVYV